MRSDMTLQGKTAIVTGGNRGIGRAIARALSGEGASCVLCARDQQELSDEDFLDGFALKYLGAIRPQGRFLHGALIDADGGATMTI